MAFVSFQFRCKLRPLLSKVSGASLHLSREITLTRTRKVPELTEVKMKSSILPRTEKNSIFQCFLHLFTHKIVPDICLFPFLHKVLVNLASDMTCILLDSITLFIK